MINIPKGTKDMLPGDAPKWQYVEKTARDVAEIYGFKEIRTPVFEHTELFSRGVGDTTDIVNKEMYTFLDKGDRSVTLKPEGTAGAVRMFVENRGEFSSLPLKAYYLTPAFRYERPQAGRLREFHQFGLEMFGSDRPVADAEVIIAADTFLKRLGIEGAKLEINSIGCRECRARYHEALKSYFRPHLDEMCELCRERFEKNPLRILDCKNEECKKVAENAPEITDYLCDDCAAHFEGVKSLLRKEGINFTVNPRIVRGLDYYTRTVFEFVSDDIGAQGTVCGGGRYDYLISEIGGGNVPAIGFAAGIERLLLLMGNRGAKFPEGAVPEIYVGATDEKSNEEAFSLVAALRRANIYAEGDLMGRSVKAQLKYADKIGAKYVVILGERELSCGTAMVRCMKESKEESVKISNLEKYIKEARS